MTTGDFLSQSLIEHVHNKNCFQNVKIFNDAPGSMASIPGPALWIILISRSRISTKVELNDRKSGLVSQMAFISKPLAHIGSITVAKAWGLDTSTLKQNYGKLENMDYTGARMIERSSASVRSGGRGGMRPRVRFSSSTFDLSFFHSNQIWCEKKLAQHLW